LSWLEDIRNLLFTCHRAREVWKAVDLDGSIKRLGSCVLEEILFITSTNARALHREIYLNVLFNIPL
jgi:hypothetical protein